ncbi:MAG: tetratricopeptide repeat protein [Pirellulales bacterium]
MPSVAEVLQQGARHQQAGQWADAERCYRQALAAEPDHPHALHLLGMLAIQLGQLPQAIELIGDAIRIDRNQATFHANLAEAYRLSGDLPKAAAANRAALKLQPQLLNAHVNLAAVLYQMGDLAAAVEQYRQVVKLAPEDASARLSLGRALKAMGQAAEAEACFRRALRIAPDHGPTHTFLCLALVDQGKLAEARAAGQAAVALNPNDAIAHNSLGAVLKDMHLLAEAEVELREAIRLGPQLAAGHNNLGALLLDLNRYGEAIDALGRAIQLDPQSFQAFCNLARALEEVGRLDEGVAAARRTIELNPGFSYAHCNLGTSLKNLGRLDEALAAYRMSVQLDPHGAYQGSNLVYALNLHGGYDAQTVFDAHLAWGRAHADAFTAASAPHTNDRTPGRRLRIGYVSAHFWAHAVNFFSEPILAAHDHQQCEVFCYSHGSKHDETNARLRSYADHWREIAQLSDQQASELIRGDQIDILVDLSGHIGGNRLLAFARKPAPVQVTYIGYQNTTGMAAMDYRLTDAWADPPGATDALYTEKLLRLPRAFFCYLPSADAPPVGPLPAAQRGYVTFGSFNNFAKVTPTVLAAWARILNAVPGSRLVVLAHAAESLRQYLHDTFAAQGVGADRWKLVNRCSRGEYLRLIADTDIALDPFPFNGHTTTCDALWQGVPVVTLAGSTYAQRFGSSAHVNLGLAELIARSVDEYVDVAARLAGDVPRLAALRTELRDRMAASPIVDAAGFTRNLESAYRAMWEHWCLQPEVGTKN